MIVEKLISDKIWTHNYEKEDEQSLFDPAITPQLSKHVHEPAINNIYLSIQPKFTTNKKGKFWMNSKKHLWPCPHPLLLSIPYQLLCHILFTYTRVTVSWLQRQRNRENERLAPSPSPHSMKIIKNSRDRMVKKYIYFWTCLIAYRCYSWISSKLSTFIFTTNLHQPKMKIK
jgi:hypothetical protein